MASANPPSPQDKAQVERAQAAEKAWRTRMWTQLVSAGGARELAFAATLRQLTEFNPAMEYGGDGRPTPVAVRRAQVDEWRRKASDLAGRDVIANASLMQGYSAQDLRLRKAAAARWAAAEPDNAAPLFFGDAPIDSLLSATRTRTRFDLHAFDYVRWVMEVFERNPPTAAEAAVLLQHPKLSLEEYAAISGMGIWAAMGIPSLGPLSEACRDKGLEATPNRRADCRHVAQVMADASDTALGASVGIALLARGAQSDSERASAEARRRQFDWRMQQWVGLSSPRENAGSEDLVRLLRDPSIDSEPVLLTRLLTEAGIPLEPPAHWQPPRRE